MNKQIMLNLIIGILVIISIIILIWNGFTTKTFETYQLRQTGEAYQTAEYSETTCGIDFDGEYSCDTDYWSEPASEVWGFIADNGIIIDSNVPQNSLSNDIEYKLYLISGTPSIQKNIPRKHFESFKKHLTYKYLILLDEEHDTSLKKFKMFSKFKQQNAPIIVDLWYSHIRNIRAI